MTNNNVLAGYACPKCFFCDEDKNEVLLLGYLKGDVEAPRGVVFNMEP